MSDRARQNRGALSTPGYQFLLRRYSTVDDELPQS